MGERKSEFERPTPSLRDGARFQPAPDVLAWINREVVDPSGNLHNPDHAHLIDADLAFLWAPDAFEKAGRIVMGQAEQVMFRAGGWQKARQEQQMMEWFGRVPTYLITLAADYCAECSDTDFCALLEHELYHIGHATDPYGAPAFDKEGRPKLRFVGHDVSEFIGVVARYGTGGPDSDLSKMVRAANARATISNLSIAHACGTCLLKAA